MQFKIATLYGVALAATTAQAVTSASQLTDSFTSIAHVANQVMINSKRLDASATDQAMLKMAEDLSQIITNAMAAIAGISATDRKPGLFSNTEEKAICVSMITSVDAADEAVVAVIKSDAVDSKKSKEAPKTVAQVLQVVEKVLESLIRGTQELVPTCGDEVDEKLGSLEANLRKGLEKFPELTHVTHKP